MTTIYRGYTIKSFKNYYIIYNSNNDEVARVDTIEEATQTIDETETD